MLLRLSLGILPLVGFGMSTTSYAKIDFLMTKTRQPHRSPQVPTRIQTTA